MLHLITMKLMIEQDLKELESGQERLQKNIIGSLEQFMEKITDHIDDKAAALNKRVYPVETEIQRLTKQ